MEKKMKAALHNLGCKVNAYETEAMQELLLDAGYEIVGFDEWADVYIINTCSVTNMADRKSRQMLHRAKKKNPKSVVVATGCYVQTSRQKVLEDVAVDIVIGNNQKSQLIELLDSFWEREKKDILVSWLDINDGRYEYEPLKVKRSGEHTRAFIKVQDGCDQFCSYCIIPFARGRVRSREIEDVVEEVKRLADSGYQEIVLTGIHLSSYGLQENYNQVYCDHVVQENLLELIHAVAQVKGICRVRLGSLEPKIITEEFARQLAAEKKICPHFHLSLQSGCEETLRRMNRKYTPKEYEDGCSILRKYFENPAITTDVIVGFPGETAEEFAKTKAFLEKVQFYEMHIFKYSKRKGTKAAQMPEQVPEKIKTLRSDALFALEKEMSETYRESFVQKKVEVLLETPMEWEGKKYYTGYTKEYIRVAFATDDNLTNHSMTGVIKGKLCGEIYVLEQE